MEEEKTNKSRMLIAPIISVAAFLVLVFGAGYAYFTSNVTLNSANYQINLPQQTTLQCSKQDCSVTITPDQMVNSAAVINTTTPKGTSTCSVTCNCTGTPGATCTYNVVLKQTGSDVYSTVAVANEFTTTITKTGACSLVTGNVNTNAAFYPAAGKTIATCTLTAGGSNNTSTVTSVFNWYNLNGNQTAHAGKSYAYRLDTTGGTVG